MKPSAEQYRQYVRTDADGKYRFRSLPSGKYELWAETPGWVNVGANDVVTMAGKTSVVTDLKFIKGGVVSARIVDAKTHQPISLSRKARVMMLVRPQPPTFRPVSSPILSPNSAGRFEFQLRPGKKLVGANVFDGDVAYSGQPSTELYVVDGNTDNVDLPVTQLTTESGTESSRAAPPQTLRQKRPATEHEKLQQPDR